MAITYDAVNDYNFVGDGATSNDTPWANLKTDLQANRDEDITVNFDAGIYQYTNNRGLFGCGKVTLQGAGKRLTLFRNASTDAWSANHRPFNTKSIFLDDGDAAEDGNHTFVSGYLIEDATEGASSVTLVTAGEASNFSVGERCLVHGFWQQEGGFPPNLRYFQYVVITAIDNGVLSITPSLNYTFLADDWYDYTATIDGETLTAGKARISPLERTNFYQPEYIKFADLQILKNPNGVVSDDVLLSVRELVLENVIIRGDFTPSESHSVLLDHVEVFDSIEGDKVVHGFTVLNGRTHSGIGSCTGINEVTVRNHIFQNGLLQASARNVLVDANLLLIPAATEYGAIQTHGSWTPAKFIARDNVIVHDGDLAHAVNTNPQATFTADGTSGNDILMADDDGMTTVVEHLLPGTLLYKTDMSDWGTISGITHDGSSNYVISGDWSSPSGTWAYYRGIHFEESGSIFVGGNRQGLRYMRAPQLVADGDSSVSFIIAPALEQLVSGAQLHYILGIPTSIRVDVTTPFTGSDTNPHLQIKIYGASSSTVIDIDLDGNPTTGYAETTTAGTDEDMPLQSASTQLDGATEIRYMQIYLRDGSTPLADAVGEGPTFTVTVTVQPIVTWTDNNPSFGS